MIIIYLTIYISIFITCIIKIIITDNDTNIITQNLMSNTIF